MNVGIMSLIIFICGIFILVYGMFFSPTEEEKIIDSSFDVDGIDKLLTSLQDKISDADKMIMELDKFSNHVQNENEKKYKELMLLYKLIDEKQQDINSEKEEVNKKQEEMIRLERQKLIEENRRLEQERIAIERKKNMTAETIPSAKQFYYETPKAISPAINIYNEKPVVSAIAKSKKANFDEVVYMYENGKNIDDIAKELGKGKGEIRLMLDLMGKEG